MKKLLFILILLVLTACVRVDKVGTHPIDKQPPNFFNMSVMENVIWEESPIFKFEHLTLRGVEGNVAILATPWKANTSNKYMVHLFGEEPPSGKLSIIAVKKDTNETAQAFYGTDSKTQSWSLGSVPTSVVNGRVDMPASMKLPSKGLWALNIYVGENLFGQIIVNVK